MKNKFMKWVKILCITAIAICLGFIAYVAYLMQSSSTPQGDTGSQAEQSLQPEQADPSTSQDKSDQSEESVEKSVENASVEKRNELALYGESEEVIPITLSDSDASGLIQTLHAADSPFRFEKYYHLEDSLSLYRSFETASAHESSLLDGDQKLDADKLTRHVLQNNEDLMAQGQNSINAFYTDLGTGEIQSICTLIAEIVNKELFDISITDAAATLEQLTIFQRTGSASNAYVTNNLTLVFNPTMTEMYGDISEISGVMEDPEDAKQAVLVHEIMHLLQYAASDSDSTNGIEAGMCRMYNVPEQEPLLGVDSLWYTWLLDASAELGMASYLEFTPGTYQKKISYLKSYNLSRFHELDLETDGLERVTFAPTLEQAFSRLQLDEPGEQNQFLKYLYSIEITQADPDDFAETYMRESGSSLTEDERTGLRMDIRTDALTYLTRNFYENLACALIDGKVVDSDTLFYLLRTWELDVYNHLKYDETDNLAHCTDFVLWHDEIQNQLFRAVAASSGHDTQTLKSLYQAYFMHRAPDDNAINSMTSNVSLEGYPAYTQSYILSAKETYASSSFSLNSDMSSYIQETRR